MFYFLKLNIDKFIDSLICVILNKKYKYKLSNSCFRMVNIFRNWIIKEYKWLAAATAKSLQSCPTLWDPIDSSPSGSPVPWILQPRTLEWVAISFSNARKWKVKVKLLSRVRLLTTSWTAAHQALPSMGFSRQEYWSGVPLPSPINDLGCLYFSVKFKVIFKIIHPHLLLCSIFCILKLLSEYFRMEKIDCFQWIYKPCHSIILSQEGLDS